jgi:hypothetical protein
MNRSKRGDDVAAFVTGIHIPVRLDDLLQRIAPVNHGFHRARFDPAL